MFRQTCYEICRGFAYLKIKHKNMYIYKYLFPIIMTLILLFLYIILYFTSEKHTLLIGKDSFSSSLLSVIATLPGFYFAGLAAIATFGNEAIDKEMPAPAPEIKIRDKGEKISVALTSRQFLSYLFSYLVIISLIICFILLLINGFSDEIHYVHTKIPSSIWNALKGAFSIGITLMLSSMTITTLHGVYFMTEKMTQL